MSSAAEVQTSVLMPVCTAVTLIEGLEFCLAEKNRPTSVSLCADMPQVVSFSCRLKEFQGEAASLQPLTGRPVRLILPVTQTQGTDSTFTVAQLWFYWNSLVKLHRRT